MRSKGWRINVDVTPPVVWVEMSLVPAADIYDEVFLPETPATMCSYLMCEKTLNFPPIFLGDIVAAETVDDDTDGGGTVGLTAGDAIFHADLYDSLLTTCIDLLLFLYVSPKI